MVRNSVLDFKFLLVF